jgi:hypothetical protein
MSRRWYLPPTPGNACQKLAFLACQSGLCRGRGMRRGSFSRREFSELFNILVND